MDVNLKTHTHSPNEVCSFLDKISKYLSIFSHTTLSEPLNYSNLFCNHILQGESHFFTYAVNSSCACCTCFVSLRKKKKGQNNNTNNEKTKRKKGNSSTCKLGLPVFAPGVVSAKHCQFVVVKTKIVSQPHTCMCILKVLKYDWFLMHLQYCPK